jgi:hypothetical protein
VAGNWRAHQARKVINSLTVTVVRIGEQVESPAFISVGHVKVTLDVGEGYRPLSVVLERQDFAEEALNEALQKLKAIQTRYGTIEKLAPVWLALDEITAA